jgi:hypothetical protein
MVTWELLRDGTNVEALFDVELVDTANPFGDHAICKIDDAGGKQFDKFPRGTRIELQVTPTDATTPIPRFTGFVVERRGANKGGADQLEVEAYSFDQFLRNSTVSSNLEGLSIEAALETIVKDDTPIDFVASNVEVGDPQELTRSFRGEKTETVLQSLAFKSQSEGFGVNDDLEFFFRPQEVQVIDNAIDDTNYLDYDIPELSNETVNEVEVFFDQGERRITVADGQDKLDLQDSLGLPQPATQAAEIKRPNITTLGDAEDAGRQFLDLRNATLTGTVTAFGRFRASPGDNINIQISSRGIDSEFTIVSVKYLWGRDETIFTIVENKGNDNAEIIVRLSESVKRIEMEGVNRDAPKNRITSTKATAQISPTVSTNQGAADQARITNTLRDIVRDGFAGGPLPDVDTIALGRDGSDASRTNTALGNRIVSSSASQSFPASSSVEYTASFNEGGIREIGLFDAAGNLLMRAVLDDSSFIFSVDIRLDVSDNSGERSVVTIEGQETVRDIIADRSPVLPDKYLYGSGTSTPGERDASLDSLETTQSLNDVLISSADTTQEFENLLPEIADDVPLTVAGGELRVQQTCFTTDSPDFVTANTILDQDSVFSNGFAEGVTDTSSRITITFRVDHRIPASDFSLLMRLRTAGNGQGIECTFNGVTWQPAVDGADFGSTVNYRELAQKSFGGNALTYTAAGGGDVEPGTFDLTVRATDDSGDTQKIDIIAPRDGRFTVTKDNQVNNPGGFLDGPELFPQQLSVSLKTAQTRRKLTEARISSSFNDVSNGQFLELSNDGSNFIRTTNSQTASATFASEERGVDVNIGLSRFGSRTGATPLTGFKGQAVSSFDLLANPDAIVADDIGVSLTRAIVPRGTLTGTTITEAGQKGSVVLLTRHVFGELEISSDDTTVISSELTQFKQE